MLPLETTRALIDTARALLVADKGLLAMDESNPTCNKRFAKLGIVQTEETRRAYRELIVSTSGLNESISGAILYDETIRQHKRDGTSFVEAMVGAGIIVGIKVDLGAKAMAGHPGETVTEGLDGLRERLAEYGGMGARFAKWRAVIAVGEVSRVERASRPMRTPWLATLRCAKRRPCYPFRLHTERENATSRGTTASQRMPRPAHRSTVR